MKTKLIPFDINQAQAGAKVVTRCGYPVTIIGCNSNKKYPIRAIIKTEDGPFTFSFTVEGKYCVDEEEHELDFFIEEEDVEAEEEEEVEETDYDPYKATVKSIADMVEIYSELQSLEELKHFYNNVRVKCREAIEYDKKWNKEQDEEPADNKPKFKIGDWVISGLGLHQITNVIENVTNHTYSYDTVSYSYDTLTYGWFNETVKDMRLWTIQDAKDGDVLCAKAKDGYFKEYLFMFSSFTENNVISTHFGYEVSNGDFYKKLTRFGRKEDFMSVTPATKEQRDLLFQKMKEDGYEWDSDKNELHKIEKEVKTRAMTNQELADWLCQCPEECREFKYETCSTVLKVHVYYEDKENEPAEHILIRKNHGEWQEPLIEE